MMVVDPEKSLWRRVRKAGVGMKKDTARTLPSGCRIVVKGKLDGGWSHYWSERWNMTPRSDGITVPSGQLIGQAKLRGLLARIRNPSLPLISLSPTPPSDPVPAHIIDMGLPAPSADCALLAE